VQGYADLAAGLEKVSEAKGAVDEAKGQVLQVCLLCRCGWLLLLHVIGWDGAAGKEMVSTRGLHAMLLCCLHREVVLHSLVTSATACFPSPLSALQEVSSTVQQITAAIKQKKVQLAPAIQELRGLRQQQQVRARICCGSCSNWDACTQSAAGVAVAEASSLQLDFIFSALLMWHAMNAVTAASKSGVVLA
jgi:hypothetical protein